MQNRTMPDSCQCGCSFVFFVVFQITHGAEAFEAGDSVILTLKDQGILEEDEHGKVTGLAEHDDELENVHMKEAEVNIWGRPYSRRDGD